MKILIADDSKVMRQIVLRTMRQAGFGHHDFVEAEDGADALDKVAAETPDLVLSDWNMPNKTGIELLRALRGSGNAVPFGFVTSEGSEEMRATAASGRRDVPHREAVHGRALRVRPLRDAGLRPPCFPVARTSRTSSRACSAATSPSPTACRSTSASPSRSIATYVDDYGHLRAVALMSFGLAARSGAAIALIPMGGVEVAEEDRVLPPNLFDNASEICNVLAAPFGDAMGEHLRLADAYPPSSAVPANLLGIAAQVAAREDVALEITGYGTGTLSLVVAV